jgi:hypothetical protein
MIICGDYCTDCIYADIDDTNKSKIIVHCDAKARDYYWGQCIPCELKKKREIVEDDTEEL